MPSDDPYFTREVDLWNEGYLDSLGVAEVVAFLEQTFDTTIPNEMLFEPDFVRISGIAGLICRELQVGAGAA